MKPPAPQRRWSTLRTAFRSGMLQSTLMKTRAKRLSTTFVTPTSTLLEVHTTKKLEATPLWKQGDASLYCAEQLEARYLLRTTPEVQEALHSWWCAVLRSLQSGGDSSACTIGHDRYISLFMAIYRQLVPGRVTSCVYQSEARRSAEQDWARDSKRCGVLERVDMLDGLFELADLYCPSVAAADYACFLHGLLLAVSIVPAGEPPLLWREKPKAHSHVTIASSSIAQSPSRKSLSRASLRSLSSLSSSNKSLQSLSKASLRSAAKPPPSPSPPTPATRAQRSRDEAEFFTPLPPLSPRRTTFACASVDAQSVAQHPKRALTPGSPLSPTKPPASSKRRLAPSASAYSPEAAWLAAAVGVPPQMLTTSQSRRVLPAIGATSTARLAGV